MHITLSCISTSEIPIRKIGRAQMEFGGGHTTRTHSHQNMLFLFPPKISMFIKQSCFISPLSCLKHTPGYSTQNAGNTRCSITHIILQERQHLQQGQQSQPMHMPLKFLVQILEFSPKGVIVHPVAKSNWSLNRSQGWGL